MAIKYAIKPRRPGDIATCYCNPAKAKAEILPYLFSKTYPSFLTVKEGSTSHLGLLPSGKKRETALLGARNRYAIRLAGHQNPRHVLRDGTA